MNPVILLTRDASPYRALEADYVDLERPVDFPGGRPVIAHPIGRGWGRSRHHLTRIRSADLELALWAVAQVQHWGGILEQPANSQLWALADLPVPGEGLDVHGGLTLPIWQSWFGHQSPRPTWLYIVGYRYPTLPEMPIGLESAASLTDPSDDAEEGMPRALAAWLFELAIRIGQAQRSGGTA